MPVFSLPGTLLPGECADYRFFEPRYLLAMAEVLKAGGSRRFVFLNSAASERVAAGEEGVGVLMHVAEHEQDASSDNIFARCTAGPRVSAVRPVLQAVEGSDPLLRVDLLAAPAAAEDAHDEGAADDAEALAELCRYRLGECVCARQHATPPPRTLRVGVLRRNPCRATLGTQPHPPLRYAEQQGQTPASAADWLGRAGVPPRNAAAFSYWLASLLLPREDSEMRQEVLEQGASERLKGLFKILAAATAQPAEEKPEEEPEEELAEEEPAAGKGASS